ncbi:hypothetical protein CspeluHIS016_0500220 [Cutaneotrichosporon spelunceum]|uniref:Peptidase A1 domain-containing protein n=1 Tax=Cutaneotrichosporon spelunceum TaxID=1672016 RepID=A0AAD3TW36_9TREE|nr:hypothetical protein CspeluHIS016_0500220 [Cutaneotrichosporon spelunceum]
MLFSALALAPVAAAVVHVQLTRRSGLVQQSIGAITTDVGSGYTIPLGLGTPPQNLSVFLGMGSGNGLTMFGCDGCIDEPFYRPNKSSTWNRTGTQPFGVAYDTAQLFGATIPNAPCAYANSTLATPQYGQATNQAGQLTLGLGLNADPNIQAIIPALAPSWDEPVFGVQLTGSGGQLSFGGVDTSLYQGSLTYIPTIKGTWNFAVDGLKVDGNTVDTTEYLASQAAAMAQAAAAATSSDQATQGTGQRKIVVRPEMGVDYIQLSPQIAGQMFGPTGHVPGAAATPPIQGPVNEAEVLRSTGMPSQAGYSYEVPCNTNATISFTINGTDYNIPPSKWVQTGSSVTNGTDTCKTRVLVVESDGFGAELYDVLVGSLFLESTYSAYRYDPQQAQIAFAELSQKAKEAEVAAADTAKPSTAVQPTASATGAANAIGHSVAGVLLAAAVAVMAA